MLIMTQDIQDLIAALQAAWNRKDGEAFAACFDETAEFGHILDGRAVGRGAIAEGHAALFAGVYAQSRIVYGIAAVEPLGDWAVAVDLDQFLDFEIEGMAFWIRAKPQLVVRRDGDDWVISSFHNRRIEGAPALPRAQDVMRVKPEQEPFRRAA